MHYALLNPIVTPKRTLRRDLFENLLDGVPGIQKDYILDLVYPGPGLDTIIDFPGIKCKDQDIFEGAQALAILKEFLEHFYMGKFLGPFPSWVKSFNGLPLSFVRTFVIKKGDYTPENPKFRVLINASEELPHWQSFQPEDQSYLKFTNNRPIKSLNDAIIAKTCSLPRAKDIIAGLYKCKLIWKLDLAKAFRHLILEINSWRKADMMTRLKHPYTGELWEVVWACASVSMGCKNSPCEFQHLFSAFVKAAIFKNPTLFGGPENLKLLYVFIDDFMGGAIGKSIQEGLHHAARQIAWLQMIGGWMGLTFLPSKLEFPNSSQTLLGLVLNVISNRVSLKLGKSEKLALRISKLLKARAWNLKDLQKICGNLVWAGLIIPKLFGFATPLIECQKLLPTSNKHISLKKIGPLAIEVKRVLTFILPIIRMDPSIHINRFLGKLKHLKVPLYSDASGNELLSSNPTPNTLGLFFPCYMSP